MTSHYHCKVPDLLGLLARLY